MMVDIGRDEPLGSLSSWRRLAVSPERDDLPSLRTKALLVAALGICTVLFAGLVSRMFAETGDTNSYALLAEAFLRGRLDVSGCFDSDCARFGDRTYIVFPPGPVLIALPFVAVFGVAFAGFVALTTMLSGVAVAAWWQILRVMKVEPATAILLLAGVAFASPLYYVTIRGDGVWFLAHATAFLFLTLAIREGVCAGSLWRAGLFVGMAFLSRQLTILAAPFVFALWLRPDEPLISLRRDYIVRGLRFAWPVAAAIGIYLAYNYARFGDPLETGYAYYTGNGFGDLSVLDLRAAGTGLVSPDYLPFNLIYLLFQGPHVSFVGTEQIDLGGLDRFGTSLLAASPFVLFAVFAPLRRTVIIGGLTILVMVVPMLFYHSNGFTQYNVQRYVLDWLPLLVYALALSVTPALRPAFALVVTYALAVNAAALLLVTLTT